VARKDGGEAGLHPSNIHDNAYAIGAVDSRRHPVILRPGRPQPRGLSAPHHRAGRTVEDGQLRPGDTVRFKRLSQTQAEQMGGQDAAISQLLPPLRKSGAGGINKASSPTARAESPQPPFKKGGGNELASRCCHRIPETDNRVAGRLTAAPATNYTILIEYGPWCSTLTWRFRVQR